MLAPSPSTASPTVSQLIDQWHAAELHRLRENPTNERRRVLMRELPPELLAQPVDALTRRQIGQWLQTMNHKPGQKRSAFSALRRVCRWAVENGLADTNPTAGLKVAPPKARERVLSEAELRAIWHGSLSLGMFGEIVRLLMLTGQRREEIGGLVWDEVELACEQRPRLSLPASRCKNKRSHTVPLAPLALAQLPAPREGYPNVFGEVPGRPFAAWGKLKGYLDRRIMPMPHWTIHDLRRSMYTHCAEKDLAPPHIIEAVVNHITGHKGGVAGCYNRARYERQKREALEAWALEVQRIVGSSSHNGGIVSRV